jgi:hypothetical protein
MDDYYIVRYVRKNSRSHATIPITIRRIYYGTRELIESQIDRESGETYVNSNPEINRVTHPLDIKLLEQDNRIRVTITDGLEEIM